MDEEVLIANSGNRRTETKPKFHDRPIKTFSIAVIVAGAVCFAVGGAVLVLVLVRKCEYSHDDYYNHQYWAVTTIPPFFATCDWPRTLSSPGIWSGLTFIACGIIGILAAKRKTICFIVTLMTMSIASNWVAVCAITLSMASHWDHSWRQVNSYPIELHILDGVVTLLCLVCFVLQWLKFVYACKAVCCDGRKGYPKIRRTGTARRHHYQPLQAQTMMYGAQPAAPQAQMIPQQPLQAQPMMYGAQPAAPQAQMTPQQWPVISPPPIHPTGVEPVYLIQGHRVIGVLPQNVPFTAPRSEMPASSQEPNSQNA